ncbi:hypothetical protein Aperf_G00000117963 [Anoplocephala perfoliata]
MDTGRDSGASLAAKMSMGPILNPPSNSPDEVKTEARIRYPTRGPFMRYLEQLVAPKSTGDRALLEKRPAPSYMQEDWPKNNVFTMIKSDAIKELRRQANERRAMELARSIQSKKVAHKIPRKYRQQFTATNKLKELIFEENLKEIHTHGRLFGPPELTFQPIRKHNIPLLEARKSAEGESQDSYDIKGENEEKSSYESWLNKHLDSMSLDYSLRESIYSEGLQAIQDDSFDRFSMGRSVFGLSSDGVGMTKFQAAGRDNFDGVNAFIDERRKVCMMNLATRTKEGEIARLKKMLEDEASFLAKEEKNLITRHDEHDKYLKTICLQTAEAIKLADAETRKRVHLTDKIKRIKYKLAHMNAECIKLEEEFIELSTYKDFLDNVAKNVEENRASGPAMRPAVKLSNASERNSTEDEDGTKIESSGLSIDKFFKNPQDLVDILAELESNNLTLIENVQEQEEACERLRLKAATLQKALNIERSTVDEHIAQEVGVISELQKEIIDIESSRNQIKDFTLLERYEAFSLGSIHQFDPPWLKESRNRRALDGEVEKPTVGQLMDILQEQIHKIHCKIFGTDESAKLDTLLMLKNLESEIEIVTKGLSKYSRMQILKAKKSVDEHNRLLARQRQKDIEVLAHDAKLKRAIEKSKEPPRWHRGRRIIERSAPPREKVKVGKVEKKEMTTAVHDDDADLFE